MYSAISRSIESYAIGFAQRTLREISAALKIISRVDGTETVVYEEQSRQRDDIAVIYINDSNFWGRILSDFDLVCRTCRGLFSDSDHCRVLPKPICFRKLTART